jgi:hypothetical protein
MEIVWMKTAWSATACLETVLWETESRSRHRDESLDVRGHSFVWDTAALWAEEWSLVKGGGRK